MKINCHPIKGTHSVLTNRAIFGPIWEPGKVVVCLVYTRRRRWSHWWVLSQGPRAGAWYLAQKSRWKESLKEKQAWTRSLKDGKKKMIDYTYRLPWKKPPQRTQAFCGELQLTSRSSVPPWPSAVSPVHPRGVRTWRRFFLGKRSRGHGLRSGTSWKTQNSDCYVFWDCWDELNYYWLCLIYKKNMFACSANLLRIVSLRVIGSQGPSGVPVAEGKRPQWSPSMCTYV